MAKPQELPAVETWSDKTIVDRKWVLEEVQGLTVEISSASWRLLHDRTEVLYLSGDAVVDNADEDRNGATVRTIQVSIDLTGAGSHVGYYWLVISIDSDDPGSEADDVFRVPVEIVDYLGVTA